MNNRTSNLLIAIVVGALLSAICLLAFSMQNNTHLSLNVRKALELVGGIPSIVGIFLGMLVSGNAHAGGRLSTVLPVAFIANTSIFSALAYLVLSFLRKEQYRGM